MKASVLSNLCTDLIIGHNNWNAVLSQDSDAFRYCTKPMLMIGTCNNLAMTKVEPTELFANLSSDCHPIAT